MKKSSYIIAGTIAGVVGMVGLAGAVYADRSGEGRGWSGHERHMAHWRGGGDDRGWRRHGKDHGKRHGWHRRGGHHGFGKGGMMKHMLSLADTNNDGKITQEEIDAARDERFSRYDTDGDGRLSLKEYEGLFVEIMQPMIVRSFQRLDPNGDAQLEKTEFDKPTERLVERFDRNDDGALSRDDRRHRWSWRKHKDRDGDDKPMRGGSDDNADSDESNDGKSN